MNTLPKEQFEYQKTLAEIGTQIAIARGVFADLEANKETFIIQREEETRDRINVLIQESQEALALVSNNQDDLTKLYYSIQELVTFLSKNIDVLKENVAVFDTVQKEWLEYLEDQRGMLANMKQEALFIRDMAAKDNEQNLIEKERLQGLQRHIESQAHSLKLAMEEFKEIQRNLPQ